MASATVLLRRVPDVTVSTPLGSSAVPFCLRTRVDQPFRTHRRRGVKLHDATSLAAPLDRGDLQPLAKRFQHGIIQQIVHRRRRRAEAVGEFPPHGFSLGSLATPAIRL